MIIFFVSTGKFYTPMAELVISHEETSLPTVCLACVMELNILNSIMWHYPNVLYTFNKVTNLTFPVLKLTKLLSNNKKIQC